MTRYTTLTAALVFLASAGTAAAQDIAGRVREVGNGTVRLTFASKPGVCGDGESFISTRGWSDDDKQGRTIFRDGRGGYSISTGSDNWTDWRNCEEGPVRVALEVDDGQVVDVKTYVGKGWRSGEQALQVSSKAAVDYLFTVIEKGNNRAGKRAFTPIIIADGVEPGSQFLRLAKNSDLSRETRKSAIFWSSQSRLPNAEREIGTLMNDRDSEVAKSAMFALSQLKTDASSRMLLSAARNTALPIEVRKSAVFWIGQLASNEASKGLQDLMTDENTEVKKSAVFALSQMRTDNSVNALINIVKTSKDREVRKAALFWLGQSNDPRALALFEEILLKN
jgi:hypothetical protein